MARELSMCRLMIVCTGGHLGAGEEGHERLSRYTRIADDTGDQLLATRLRTVAAMRIYEAENLASARGEVQRGIRLAETLTHAFPTWDGVLALLMLNALEGKFENVLAHTDKVISALGFRGWWFGVWYRFLAWVLLLAATRATREPELLLARVQEHLRFS